MFEHEHVVNPQVKVGNSVKAGTVIGEVGPSQNTWQYDNLGVFEIGIWRPGPDGRGGAAECPFNYLDPRYKQEIHNKI